MTTPIRQKVQAGRAGEDLFFDLALEDLTRAADLFKPVFERTDGVDGWVSLEVSPLLAHDTASTLAAAKALHDRAGRPNLFIKIPGTPEGLPAIEEAIFAGVPGQRHAAVLARAICGGGRGLSARRRAAHRGRAQSRGRLGRFGVRQPLGRRGRGQGAARRWPTVSASPSAQRTYKAYRELLGSPRWQRAANAGARPQRLLWASTGTKDPKAAGHPLCEGARRAVHGQHHARGHPQGFRRSRRGRRRHAGRRRRRRGGARELRQGGHRCRRAGRPSCRTRGRNPSSNPGTI